MPVETKKPKSEKSEEKSRLFHKVAPEKVRSDHIIALVWYTKVNSASRNGSYLNVNNLDTGKDFSIDGHELVANSISADTYEEEVTVTKTKAAELLVTSYNRPFTVNFVKDTGEERMLRGRLIEPEPLLGRSKVEDLDAPVGKRFRLVDHRTIRSIVVDGVKYTVPVK